MDSDDSFQYSDEDEKAFVKRQSIRKYRKSIQHIEKQKTIVSINIEKYKIEENIWPLPRRIVDAGASAEDQESKLDSWVLNIFIPYLSANGPLPTLTNGLLSE